MENEQSFAVFIKKLAVWAGILLPILGVVVWVVCYATFSANVAKIMPVRKFYNERVLEKIQLPDNLPYIIQTRDIVEGTYEYELWGRIMSIDYANYMMMIQDKRGGEWQVRMINGSPTEASKVEIVIQERTMERESGRVYGKAVSIPIGRREPENNKEYLQVGDMIDVVWKDELTLTEIMQQNKSGRYLVTVPSDIARPIRKVVGR